MISLVREAEILVVGAGVVSHDAVQASDRNIKIMIQKAIDSTDDVLFHDSLYDFLFEKNLDLYLLNLETRHIENFLRQKDEKLLYKYIIKKKNFLF